MKTLHINRHAKSSWKDNSLRDYDRPLNKRGKINAAFMAEKFANDHTIDLIMSSPAKRAKRTAQYFAAALGIDENTIQYEEMIYGSDVSELMNLLKAVPKEIESVMLFGHNPTFTELAWHLDHNFRAHVVTCARVQIEFDVDDWSLIGKDLGRMVAHHYPRMFPEMEDL